MDLVGEAVADMPEAGEVVVGTRQYTLDDAAVADFPGSAPGDYLRVTVKDSGCGLSPARLERIFYPETTARPAAAAAWQSMHRLGGFAAAESVEGVGTAVHLYFACVVELEKRAEQPVAEDVQALAAE
jgi:signal transduction histidine kinase